MFYNPTLNQKSVETVRSVFSVQRCKNARGRVSVHTHHSDCLSPIVDSETQKKKKLLLLTGLTAPGRPVLVFRRKSCIAHDVRCAVRSLSPYVR